MTEIFGNQLQSHLIFLKRFSSYTLVYCFKHGGAAKEH